MGVLDGVFGTVRHGLVAEGRVGPSLIRPWCMPIKAGRPEDESTRVGQTQTGPVAARVGKSGRETTRV